MFAFWKKKKQINGKLVAALLKQIMILGLAKENVQKKKKIIVNWHFYI